MKITRARDTLLWRASTEVWRIRLSAVSVFPLWAEVLFAQVPAPNTVIRVPVRLVTAPTLVISKEGLLVPGLNPDDFRLLDNGSPQQLILDDPYPPISLAIAVQVSRDVREYIPFIARTGRVFDDLLVGETGEAAVLTYSGEVAIAKSFDHGDVQSSLRNLSVKGRRARMIDAGMRAIRLLKERSSSRSRVLLFVGQPMDSGSESRLADLEREAESGNVSVYALVLPEVGKAFVSDTFSLKGLSSSTDRGGFEAGVDLGSLGAVLNRSGDAGKGVDPFSILTAATGGAQMHFRRQNELERAISAAGVELRSTYLLSYAPSSTESGYHTIHISVDVPGAKVFSRSGYWRGEN